MEVLLNENRTLKLFRVDSFENLNKNHIPQVAQNLDKLDPEVAKKLLEQFPAFSSSAKSVIGEYMETVKEMYESSNEIDKELYHLCNQQMEDLREILKDDNLSFEEKKYVISVMNDIINKMHKKDSEKKMRDSVLITIVGVTVLVSLCIIGAQKINY